MKKIKNIFILSKGDIIYGDNAAASRMNNYAKALSNKNKVFMISLDKLTKKSEFVELEENIFAIQNNEKKGLKLIEIISTIKAVLKFNELYSTIKGDKYIIYYPRIYTIFIDIILLSLYGDRMFAEINEVRKYSAEKQGVLAKICLYLYSLIYESTFKFYRGIIYISKNINSYYNNKNKNCIIVPILSDFSNTYTSFYKQIKKKDELVFVFTGTVSFEKENLEELIYGFQDFVEKTNKAKMLLYGSITEYNKEKLSQLTKRLKLYDKVEYMGNLKRVDVINALVKADCLLLPRSHNKQNYYGFSTKLGEYAISGTPIILTNTGVVSDFFKDQENCLMCKGYNRHDFKEKFLEFASLDENEKKRISNNAFETAKIHFDYRNYSTKLDEFIK